MKKVSAWVFMIAVFIAIGGCGEREQVAQGERSYQGKVDGKAWDNAGEWSKGDRASWETHIKARQLVTQHEHKRIYQ